MNLPNPGHKVIAFYLNPLGKVRAVMAAYIPQYWMENDPDRDDVDGDYCENTDTYYCPAGWYEMVENWDDYTHLKMATPFSWQSINYPTESWKK